MRSIKKKDLPKLPSMRVAVIGHVEWVSFIYPNQLPKPGIICHAIESFEEPAGGGAVAAVKLAKLIGQPVDLFTALGKDLIGERSYQRLTELGVNVHAVWKDSPTRKGISMVDSQGDRAITVIGERLQPNGADDLPWEILKVCQGAFVTATDALGLKHSREANLLAGTPRIRIPTLNKSEIQLDVLIGSKLDPDENISNNVLVKPPKLRIATEGEQGGEVIPGGRYKAAKIKGAVIDTYGCGDSFAAGVTAGLSAGWNLESAINLGAHCGANCVEHKGPYGPNQ
ncbi:PfkB family carbohydrate kinase [Prochlorococcus sp. MIT 1300]|uniref:PfkB family carbohydrate kinase n=1 Tax=Prochlorococcus sp. MIT 1300 TaxID=3096218 RepID=UPI002A7651E0|nr:PfkB family carbohydrate kinase [Prochlorococcus sp. MIT 1300]